MDWIVKQFLWSLKVRHCISSTQLMLSKGVKKGGINREKGTNEEANTTAEIQEQTA